MARPKRNERPHHLHVTIGQPVDSAVRHLLPKDILGERVKQGAYSALVDSLLRQWVKDQGVDPLTFKEDGE